MCNELLVGFCTIYPLKHWKSIKPNQTVGLSNRKKC